MIETPNQLFAEYTAHTTAAGTGRLIHHLFAASLVAKNGKIKLLRESLNVVAAAQALNPNGVADLPPPAREIFSVPPDYGFEMSTIPRTSLPIHSNWRWPTSTSCCSPLRRAVPVALDNRE